MSVVLVSCVKPCRSNVSCSLVGPRSSLQATVWIAILHTCGRINDVMLHMQWCWSMWCWDIHQLCEQFSKADPHQTVVRPPSTVHLSIASCPGQIHELTVVSTVPPDKSNHIHYNSCLTWNHECNNYITLCNREIVSKKLVTDTASYCHYFLLSNHTFDYEGYHLELGNLLQISSSCFTNSCFSWSGWLLYTVTWAIVYTI